MFHIATCFSLTSKVSQKSVNSDTVEEHITACVPFDNDPFRPERLLRGRHWWHSELAHASQTLIVFNWGRKINVLLRLSGIKKNKFFFPYL